jgi:hypothetical protein
MPLNPKENFGLPLSKLEPASLGKELLSEFWSDLEKSLDKSTVEKAEKILGNKAKLTEIISDLLNDELIVRQEKIKSEEQNLGKIKNDILLEINKKITFYIENYPLFEKCREIFSNAKNLEELFLIKEPLIKIARKIGLYDTKESPETLRRNENQKGKTLFEHPTEIFKFIIDPEYVKAKREELQNINKTGGIYMPNDNNPDGGDAWEVKRTDQKETCTVIDIFGHGLSQSYSKLFIGKIISLLGDKDEDLFKVDNFLLDIDTAASFQFQLNTTMIRVEIEGNTLNAKLSGDAGFLIYRPETNEMSVCGLSLNYPKIKNIDANIKKTHTIGAGFNTSPSRFTTSVNPKDSVIVFSDSCMKEHKNGILVARTISNFLNEQKGKTQKATGLIKRIENLVKNPSFIKDDDITIVELNKQKKFM